MKRPDAPLIPGSPEDWLRHAERDLATARLVIESGETFYEQACFHAQQTAEKAIKAVYVCRTVEFPFIHDIASLCAILREAGVAVPHDVAAAHHLSLYAVAARYPGLDEEPSADEARAALASAAMVLNWAKEIVKGKEKNGR